MQHHEWKPKSFFRNQSAETIAVLEAKFGFTFALDPDKPPSDQAYHAFVALPDERRLPLQSQLLIVNDMCSTHARSYLEGLARVVYRGQPTRLGEMGDWSVHQLAMWLYLDDPDRFLEVHRNYALDMIESLTEFRGSYPVEVRPSPEGKERIRKEMSLFARDHAGGAQCQVEDFDGVDKFGIVVYREDELTPVEQFDSGIIIPVWQRPVVRIAAMFYPDTSTLMIKAPRKEEREILRDLFASTLIGDSRYFDDPDRSLYNFEPLRTPGFRFPTHPADGIDIVSVVNVLAGSAHSGARRLRIELDHGQSLAEVHQVLAMHGVDLTEDAISEVLLRFQFAGTGNSRFRTAKLRPGGTNLKDVPRDRLIRRYLREWGFDERKSVFAVAVPTVGAATV